MFKQNISLKNKYALTVGLLLVVSLILVVTLENLSVRKSVKEAGVKAFEFKADNYANRLGISITGYKSIAAEMSKSVQVILQNEKASVQLLSDLLFAELRNYNEVTGISIILEPDVLVAENENQSNAYFDKFNRMALLAYKESSESLKLTRRVGYDIQNPDDYYFSLIRNGKPFISEPFEYAYPTKNEQIFCFSYPIYDKKNIFIGALVVDIDLSELTLVIENWFNENNAHLSVFTYKGNILYSSTARNDAGKHISDLLPFWEQKLKSVTEYTTFKSKDLNTPDILIPMFSNSMSGNIAINYYATENYEHYTAKVSIWFRVLLIIALSILAALFFYSLLERDLLKPLRKSLHAVKQLANGEIPENIQVNTKNNNEIHTLNADINTLIESISGYTRFANEIGAGNLNVEFNVKGENDILGNSLLVMQANLKKAQVAEIEQKRLQEQTAWTNKGLAEFNILLRHANKNRNDFAYDIIKNLTEYLNTTQGALFVLETNDAREEYLELIAAFAYNKKRFLKRTFLPGEGLVGRCALEKKSIILREVPAKYIKVTSGLGKVTPTALLLVPMVFNDKLYGVIELAGFNHFLDYQIKFVEKLGENIAASLSAKQSIEKNDLLLAQFRSQSEELASQEEELRQNLEELLATQEEAARKEYELHSIIDAIDNTVMYAELTDRAVIVKANSLFCSFYNITSENAKGKNYFGLGNSMFSENNLSSVLTAIQTGETVRNMRTVMHNREERILLELFSAITDSSGLVNKILVVAYEITAQVQAENKINELLQRYEELKFEVSEENKFFEKSIEKLSGLLTVPEKLRITDVSAVDNWQETMHEMILFQRKYRENFELEVKKLRSFAENVKRLIDKAKN